MQTLLGWPERRFHLHAHETFWWYLARMLMEARNTKLQELLWSFLTEAGSPCRLLLPDRCLGSARLDCHLPPSKTNGYCMMRGCSVLWSLHELPHYVQESNLIPISWIATFPGGIIWDAKVIFINPIQYIADLGGALYNTPFYLSETPCGLCTIQEMHGANLTFSLTMVWGNLSRFGLPGVSITTSIFRLPALSIETSELGESWRSTLIGEFAALTAGVPRSMSPAQELISNVQMKSIQRKRLRECSLGPETSKTAVQWGAIFASSHVLSHHRCVLAWQRVAMARSSIG